MKAATYTLSLQGVSDYCRLLFIYLAVKTMVHTIYSLFYKVLVYLDKLSLLFLRSEVYRTRF